MDDDEVDKRTDYEGNDDRDDGLKQTEPAVNIEQYEEKDDADDGELATNNQQSLNVEDTVQDIQEVQPEQKSVYHKRYILRPNRAQAEG